MNADGGCEIVCDTEDKPKGPLIKQGLGPSPFEVSLTTYPMQPWTNRNVNLRQWFNYGLNPATWTKYAINQMALFTSTQTSR